MKNIFLNTANVAVASMLLLSQAATAQIQDTRTELLKPFQAKLAKSQKFEAKPHRPQIDTNANKQLQYIVPTYVTQVTYEEPTIRPLAMPRSKPPESKSFYAKAGFGYPLSPLVEISYHNKNIEKWKFGITAKHHSLLKGNSPYQTFSQTGADANLTYFSEKNIALGGYIGIDYNTNMFYGIDSLLIDITPEEQLKQNFLNFEAGLNIFNGTVSKSNFNYRGDVDFHYYADRNSSSEISVSPSFKIEKWFGKSKNRNPFRLDVGMNYLSFNDQLSDATSNSTNILLVYLRPNFTFKAGDFKAKLGVDLGTNEGDFYINPDVEISYSIAKGMLTLYGGAVGQVRQNNFRSLTQYNPFLVSNPEIHHTNYLEFFGGAKGSVKRIGYDVKAGYALTRNLPLFLNADIVNTSSDAWRFQTVYDTVGIVFVRGALDFRLVDNLLVGGIVSYNIYTPKNAEKAWHLPTLETNFFASYDFFFNKKKQPMSNYLTVRAEFYLNAGVPYINDLSDKATLGGLYDFNLGFQYKASENVGLFLQLNNIANNRTQRWNGYRQLGFNGMVGVELYF